MTKTLALCSICVVILTTACGRTRTLEQRRQDLLQLASEAKKGNSAQAVAKGEEAMRSFERTVFEESRSLTQAAEDAFNFEVYDAAMEMFEAALDKDKGNEKANAYVAILRPLRHLKGYSWRSATEESGVNVSEEVAWMFAQDEDNAGTALARFLYAHYGEKFKSDSEAQEQAIRPSATEWLRSLKNWDVLATDQDIDIDLYLPLIMPSDMKMRLRYADVIAGRSLALAFGVYLKAMGVYQADKIPNIIKDNLPREERLARSLTDPQFGLITDPQFYTSLKGRFLDFVQGTDFALSLLHKRKQNFQNHQNDFFQINQTSFNTCPSVTAILYDRELSDFPENIDISNCQPPTPFESPEYVTIAHSQSRKVLTAHWGTNTVQDLKWLKEFKLTVASNDKGVDHLQEDLAFLKALTTGPKESTFSCGGGSEIRTWIDLPTYLRNPVTDLKKLQPKYENGAVTSLADRTIHGLFPQGLPCLSP